MPTRCSVCTHPKRDEANRRLLAQAETGETLAAIGQAYGLTSSALDRHKRNHLRVASSLVSEARNALTIVQYAADLYERATNLLTRAEAGLDGSPRSVQAAVAAVREVRGTIDQLARLVVTAPPEAPEAGNSWLDEAITQAVQAMAPAALPSGRALEPDVAEAEIVQAPD